MKKFTSLWECFELKIYWLHSRYVSEGKSRLSKVLEETMQEKSRLCLLPGYSQWNKTILFGRVIFVNNNIEHFSCKRIVTYGQFYNPCSPVIIFLRVVKQTTPHPEGRYVSGRSGCSIVNNRSYHYSVSSEFFMLLITGVQRSSPRMQLKKKRRRKEKDKVENLSLVASPGKTCWG